VIQKQAQFDRFAEMGNKALCISEIQLKMVYWTGIKGHFTFFSAMICIFIIHEF